MTTIPDAAVEAARAEAGGWCSDDDVRRALAAALPHLVPAQLATLRLEAATDAVFHHIMPDGDGLGVMLHEHMEFHEGASLTEQITEVRGVCMGIARAALAAAEGPFATCATAPERGYEQAQAVAAQSNLTPAHLATLRMINVREHTPTADIAPCDAEGVGILWSQWLVQFCDGDVVLTDRGRAALAAAEEVSS